MLLPGTGRGGAPKKRAILSAAAARGAQVGMAVSPSDIPNSTLENFVVGNANYVYPHSRFHWGSLFPTSVSTLDTSVQDQADEVVAFATARGLTMRYHALTWEPLTPADLEAAATSDMTGTLSTWFNYVNTRYGSSIGPAGIDVANETIDLTGIGYNTGKLPRAGGTDGGTGVPLYIPAAMTLARSVFPTKRLAITDYCTIQGFTTAYSANARTSVLNLLDYLIGLGLKPDIWGEQAHLNVYPDGDSRGNYDYDQDSHARFIREIMDRGIKYHFHEHEVHKSAGSGMSDATFQTRSAEFETLLFDVWNDLGCGDTWGTQGIYNYNDGSKDLGLPYDTGYAITSRGTAILNSLRNTPLGTGPNWIDISGAGQVLGPSCVAGTLSALHPTNQALTWTVQAGATGCSANISGGTTLNVTGVDFVTNPTVTVPVRATDTSARYKDEVLSFTVLNPANLYAPGTFVTAESWTGSASVTFDGSKMVWTAVALGNTRRKTFDFFTDGHVYAIAYDLVATANALRTTLNGTVVGTAHSVTGAWVDYLQASSSTDLRLEARVGAFTGSVDNLVVVDVTIIPSANLYAPGTFLNDEGYTLAAGVAPSGGVLVFTATPVGNSARKSFPFITGHSYRIRGDAVVTSGNARFSLSNAAGTTTVEGTNWGTTGAKDETLVAVATMTELRMTARVGAFTGSMDNLVVTDVT